MPDKPAGEPTEQPTTHRLEKASEQGQLPQSAELPSAMMIIMLILVLMTIGPGLLEWFIIQTREGFVHQVPDPLEVMSFSDRLRTKGTEAMGKIMPVAVGGLGVGILSSLLIGGWKFAPKGAEFKLSKISMVQGFKNLLSLKSLVHLVVSLTKMIVIGTIVYIYLKDKLSHCLNLRWSEPYAITVAIFAMLFGVTCRIAIGMMVIALLDVLYQKWEYKRKLKMTKQEVKEERKQFEGSPEVRSRIRSIQIEMVRKRMLQEVATADVVIANPTHISVAIRYDAVAMAAPVVVAKGPDLMAEKIKEIARAHNVKIIYRRDLAWALYRTVKVGHPVPEALFVAVAEVLAMIYRLGGTRRAKLRQD